MFRECSYDQESDVLYLSIGRPRPAIVWESPEGVLVRLDPETRDLVGLTVLNAHRAIEMGEIMVTIPEPDDRRTVGVRIPRHNLPLRIGRSCFTACR